MTDDNNVPLYTYQKFNIGSNTDDSYHRKYQDTFVNHTKTISKTSLYLIMKSTVFVTV